MLLGCDWNISVKTLPINCCHCSTTNCCLFKPFIPTVVTRNLHNIFCTEDDWESFHYSKVREMEGHPLSLHHDDVIVKAIPSVSHNSKVQGEEEEVVLLSYINYQICWLTGIPLFLPSLPPPSFLSSLPPSSLLSFLPPSLPPFFLPPSLLPPFFPPSLPHPSLPPFSSPSLFLPLTLRLSLHYHK